VDKLRIAVVGAGLIGRRHVELIGQSAHCELVALVDTAPATVEFAAHVGVPIYSGLADLFARQRLDGVIVATPNGLHLPHGLECVHHGVPALIEKPIADTVASGARLCAAAEQAHVPLLIGHHRRHNPLLTQAGKIIAGGALGKLVAVIGSATFYKPDRYFQEGPWRTQPGGGPILINMVHEVDNLRFLAGEIVAVQATSSRAVRGFPVEDTVAITLRFANGALGTFLLSDTAASPRSWEQTTGENPVYARADDEDCYLLAGTRGSLGIPTMRLRMYPGERSWGQPFHTEVVRVDRADPLARQLEHFCAVIRGQAEPLAPGRDALQTLRVTLAIQEAASTGQTIATGNN
jgi:predicted dehydrogenase